MWLRAVKRDIQIILGVRSGTGADAEEAEGVSLLNTMDLKCDSTGSGRPRLADGELGAKSTVVELKASAESGKRMEDAIARLKRLAAADDKTREKQRQKRPSGKNDKGKGKGKRPSGPNLARTRLTDSLVTGTVDEWKGSYGWIKPHEKVNHHQAAEHAGRLYIHKIDLEWWVKALTPGSFCRFHVYVDANSLGAEECTELKDDAAGDEDGDINCGNDARQPKKQRFQ